MTETLSIILYSLGSILLVVLIILGIKLIKTMNKIEVVVDDITKKVNEKFKDAFIVAFVQGKRVDTQQAIALFKQNNP